MTTTKELFCKEFKRGDNSQERFRQECTLLGINCEPSSREEDMKEHFDFTLSMDACSFRVDVKGLKKISRQDLTPQEDYHYVELVNVNGDKGWLFGRADLFAFETFGYWMLVKKEALIKFVKERVSKEKVNTAADCLYKLYSRPGRQDVITMVKSIDLMGMASKRIKKTVE